MIFIIVVFPTPFSPIKIIPRFDKSISLSYFPNNLLKLIKSNKDKFAGFQISIDGSNEEITYKLRQIKNTFSKSIDTIKK